MAAAVKSKLKSQLSSEQNAGHDVISVNDTELNSSSRRQHVQKSYDDDRNQRWLAGQGMLQLRDFCIRRGTNENIWHTVPMKERSIVSEYARRVMELREPRTKRFILDYALTQGVGGGCQRVNSEGDSKTGRSMNR